MKSNKKSKGLGIISWIAVFGWMLMIFMLSAQPAHQSNGLSKGITEVIVETVEKVTAKSDLELDFNRINHLLRKNTHFFAYFILGILLMLGMRTFRLTLTQRSLAALGACILYAISDETHQLFVPGRGAQITDVGIDSSGALTGIVLFLVIRAIFVRNRTQQPGSEY